jgi:predicted RNA binding protein YcfA (HicA-like mRNA interferase family)
MRSLKPREVIKLLQDRGFYIHHQHGSHVILKSHVNPILRVTVPLHTKDLKIGTLLSILRQAEISKEQIN